MTADATVPSLLDDQRRDVMKAPDEVVGDAAAEVVGVGVEADCR